MAYAGKSCTPVAIIIYEGAIGGEGGCGEGKGNGKGGSLEKGCDCLLGEQLLGDPWEENARVWKGEDWQQKQELFEPL
jgi:hypothetical protein